ncbi:MAG TPA: hypothetical protein VJN02_03060 [Gammaproteobacteria bacterium]|nr:hypothetical protein [Gammaproteobacteria bacterium]
MPLNFTNSEKFIELIESEFSREIKYYATSDVAVTAHAVGGPDAENWTQELFERKIITSLPLKEKGDRFIEVERTLTALYCSYLQKLNLDEAYNAFIEAQKNNSEIHQAEILRKGTFNVFYQKINHIINDKDKADILMRLIIYSDLGKSPQFKRTVKQLAEQETIVIDLSLDPDDLISEMFIKFDDKQLESILPSFSHISQKAKNTLRAVYPIMQACFGHIYFLERGEKTFQIIANALSKLPTEERIEALNLVYLAQFYDGVGAQGQRKIRGSLTCTENFYQGYHFIYEALMTLNLKLNETSNVSDAATFAFNDYLNKRAKLLGFESPLSPEKQFLTRMGCTLRGFTAEFGQILLEEFQKLESGQKQLLITQLSFDSQGLEGWTKAHYIATTPQNVSRALFANNCTHDAIVQALKAEVCFAMLIEKMTKEFPSLVTEKARVISFGEVAFLAGKSPKDFEPDTFDPKDYTLDLKTSKIVTLPSNQKQISTTIPNQITTPEELCSLAREGNTTALDEVAMRNILERPEKKKRKLLQGIIDSEVFNEKDKTRLTEQCEQAKKIKI